MVEYNEKSDLELLQIVKQKLSKSKKDCDKKKIAFELIEKYKMLIARNDSDWRVKAYISEKDTGSFSAQSTGKKLWREVMLVFLELDNYNDNLKHTKELKSKLIAHKGLAYVQGYREKLIIQCNCCYEDEDGFFFNGVTADSLYECAIPLTEIKSIISFL